MNKQTALYCSLMKTLDEGFLASRGFMAIVLFHCKQQNWLAIAKNTNNTESYSAVYLF